MRNLTLIPLTVLLFLTGIGLSNDTEVSEESILVSYAQDLYRQSGLNMPRSAFDLEETKDGMRIFFVNLISRKSSLSADVLEAFLKGGAVSQHARQPFDFIVISAELEFSQDTKIIFQAGGECCENLYNNRMTVENFTQSCLRMK
ncbi:MAG: hypothetical protein K9N35_06665 [Candidatus Marinimicrobia bacterium]|nr:hypothetical protein [Candidatus Neomarinimicrobiota bacterium]